MFLLRSFISIIDVVTKSEPKEATEDGYFNTYSRFAHLDAHRSGKEVDSNGDESQSRLE
jgi:hypothetical protein